MKKLPPLDRWLPPEHLVHAWAVRLCATATSGTRTRPRNDLFRKAPAPFALISGDSGRGEGLTALEPCEKCTAALQQCSWHFLRMRIYYNHRRGALLLPVPLDRIGNTPPPPNCRSSLRAWRTSSRARLFSFRPSAFFPFLKSMTGIRPLYWIAGCKGG